MTAERNYDIVLWGSTQVGKTTALVAYLANHAKWLAEDEATRKQMWHRRDEWNRLRQNQLVTGTAESIWNPLGHCDGGQVRFRDVRGHSTFTQDTKGAEEAAVLRQAAGALLFLEWPTSRGVDNEIAVENALAQLSPPTPRALVITKCESRMTPQQFATCVVNPLTFARDNNVSASMQRLLTAFEPSAIFPITVYGWKDDLPAQYYDEFGQFVPWAIEPAMVERPFDYIVKQARAQVRA
jgi:hypothetical protein